MWVLSLEKGEHGQWLQIVEGLVFGRKCGVQRPEPQLTGKELQREMFTKQKEESALQPFVVS